jgi:hypothetical protein
MYKQENINATDYQHAKPLSTDFSPGNVVCMGACKKQGTGNRMLDSKFTA